MDHIMVGGGVSFPCNFGQGLWRRIGCPSVRPYARVLGADLGNPWGWGGLLSYCTPSVIINFSMPDIWKPVTNNQTITIKQNVIVQERMHPEKFLSRRRARNYGDRLALFFYCSSLPKFEYVFSGVCGRCF